MVACFLIVELLVRCTAGILFIPVTVIKTRFESGVYTYNGILTDTHNVRIPHTQIHTQWIIDKHTMEH